MFDLLKFRGFGPRWLKWITSLLQSTSSSILINGQPGRWFISKRGLKQGNPLSPMLFILVADTLDRILRQAANENMISGIGPLDTTGQFICLQFADDTLLLCNAVKDHIKSLKLILYSFELLTGLKINFNKTSIVGLGITKAQTESFSLLLDAR